MSADLLQGDEQGQPHTHTHTQHSPYNTCKYPHTQVRHEVMGIVKSVFPPEFLNRLDEIAMFSPLSESKVAQIRKFLHKQAIFTRAYVHVRIWWCFL